jgi:hypothetical protein
MIQPVPPIPNDPETLQDEAAVKAAAGWVQNLSRTLKTCRLYDASNPAVVRFREQLHDALREVLEQHGDLALRFTSDDVQYAGVSLYPARSRDDNLALPFFRDGIRGLTCRAGVTREELNTLVDALLTVTGGSDGEDDLVTLLWQADLPHLSVEHIAAEGDVVGPSSADAGEVVPWPTGAQAEEKEPQEGEAAPAAAEPDPGASPRSDDWDIGDTTEDLEACWRSMHANIQFDVQRYQNEYALERATPTVTVALSLASAFANAEPNADDLAELSRFLPRVLRMAVTHGDWRAASGAIQLLGWCGGEWSLVGFGQELNQPISVAGVVQWLDQQDDAQLGQFIAFAGGLGAPGLDLMNLVMVEVQDPGHRSRLADAVVEACRAHPEQLAGWLADPRPQVVRAVVHMLARIGGPSMAGMLRAVATHPDEKVRWEVVTAMRQADPEDARSVLARMIEDPDTRTLCAVLQILSDRRDESFALRLIEFVNALEFEARPEEERRAIYHALGAVAGDEVVADIEATLHDASWFQRGPDPHRAALARCLVRIGTPAAREALDRGIKSKKPVVRKVCEDALEGTTDG